MTTQFKPCFECSMPLSCKAIEACRLQKELQTSEPTSQQAGPRDAEHAKAALALIENMPAGMVTSRLTLHQAEEALAEIAVLKGWLSTIAAEQTTPGVYAATLEARDDLNKLGNAVVELADELGLVVDDGTLYTGVVELVREEALTMRTRLAEFRVRGSHVVTCHREGCDYNPG